MLRDTKVTERIGRFLATIIELTEKGKLPWNRQVGSAHRYARWNNNLLILGPSDEKVEVPRYLFVTPFDSPACLEVNSEDEDFGQDVLKLVALVEKATSAEPAVDPFAITEEMLGRLD
ncbi:MAG TPA: hypothetical protein VJ124_18175 [Pyrinomonadaceae bacterium]|nr:hypothetical protein [Pyrinomonadaceae bacterium]